MGATDSEMGAPEGLLSVFFIAGLLLGTCLSEQACVGDACFDQSIHQLKIERSKTDPTSGLKYKEEEKEGKRVVNENALLATFKDLDGGEDAVRDCLQIPEVYEYDEIEYYYYDYEDYFDDYLEESASENRQRRAAGEKGEKPKNRKNNCNGKKGNCKKSSKRRNRNGGEK